MKNWEIWSEGYSATGEYAPAHLLGEEEAETFIDACRKWAIEHDKGGNYYREENGQPIHWGCWLFDNKKDAQKSFG